MPTTTAARPRPSYIAWTPLLWIAALHLGALLSFVPGYVTWTALGLCLFLGWSTGGIGICMTYHRLLAHRSFAIRGQVPPHPDHLTPLRVAHEVIM